jgi:hypothetical protein
MPSFTAAYVMEQKQIWYLKASEALNTSIQMQENE